MAVAICAAHLLLLSMTPFTAVALDEIDDDVGDDEAGSHDSIHQQEELLGNEAVALSTTPSASQDIGNIMRNVVTSTDGNSATHNAPRTADNITG